MKIRITKEARKYITLADAAEARKIIESEKDADFSAEEAAEMAVNAVAGLHNDFCKRIVEASAEIAYNHRVWNYYHDYSGHLDVWITATAKTYNGFYEIGVYLTDVYSITANNAEEIASHMYIKRYVKA